MRLDMHEFEIAKNRCPWKKNVHKFDLKNKKNIKIFLQ